MGHRNKETSCAIDEQSDEVWRSLPNRGSVHEMMKRFQKIPEMHNVWRTPRLVSSEQMSSLDHCENSPRRRIQQQGTALNDWHAEIQDNQSESSEAEDDADPNQKRNGNIENHYDRASDNSIAKMPYRSRSAVYSPTPFHHDAHNDSGYSTRLYGSSKGASPSLSGQLECDIILSPTEMHYPKTAHLALLEQPGGQDLTVYEHSTDNIVINIGTASLV